MEKKELDSIVKVIMNGGMSDTERRDFFKQYSVSDQVEIMRAWEKVVRKKSRTIVEEMLKDPRLMEFGKSL